MNRRDFLKHGSTSGVAAGVGARSAWGVVPAHNWCKYDFGSGPHVHDRLNQGPFPQYPPDAVIPSDEVVMTTTPSNQVVPGYGKGLVTYITADMGTAEIQSWQGRLDFPDYLKLVFKLAKKYDKRIATDSFMGL